MLPPLALRAIARSPMFTITAAVSLGIGIGANTLVFSVMNALLLKPLAVHEPGRLYRIGQTREGEGFFALSHAEYRELRESVAAFEGVVGHQTNTGIVETDGTAVMSQLELVTGDYFDVLGVRPVVGRGFVAEEDRVAGAAAVVVISHEVWRTRFDSDPGVPGRVLRLNGRPYTIVGVAPADFVGTFAGFRIDVWVPVMMLEQALPGSGTLARRGDRFLMLVGRLRDGHTVQEAEAQLKALASRWSAAHPEISADAGLRLAPAGGVHPFLAGLVRAFVTLMMGMVGVVLLIACANVANLMLARVLSRWREIAVRSALGAGRWRIARYFLTEGALVALLGGGLGVMIAVWAARVLSTLRPDVGVPVSLDVRVDVRVLTFALLLTAVTAVVFSVGPALRASEPRFLERLRSAGPSGSPAVSGARRLLVVVQVALSAMLLFGAALLIRRLQETRALDAGFDASNVLLVGAAPELLGHDEARSRGFWMEYAERARGLPGIRSVSLALFVPMGDRGDAMRARPFESAESSADAAVPYNLITPGYFETVRIGLRRGRDFTDRDVTTGPEVAILSAAMASRFWPDADAIGRRLRVVDRGGRERIATVVGVADDIALAMQGEAPRMLLYLPFSQWYRPDMLLHAQHDGRAGVAAALVRALHETEPRLPARVRTMAEASAFTLIPLRIARGVLIGAGAIGLFLAATGVFGLIAYTVSRQSRDIAIRMALGAERRRVQRMIMGQALRLTLTGLGVGIGAAFLLVLGLRRALFGVTPADPLAFTSVALVFAVVSLLAAWAPARRASKLEPAHVLKHE